MSKVLSFLAVRKDHLGDLVTGFTTGFPVERTTYGWAIRAAATDAEEAALDQALRWWFKTVTVEQAFCLTLWEALCVRGLAKIFLRRNERALL